MSSSLASDDEPKSYSKIISSGARVRAFALQRTMSEPANRAVVNARAWRCLAVVLVMALVVPRIWQRGMFLDGITYAVVARNMALGIGSLWAPSFSSTVYSRFFEQLPLGLWLEAQAFAVFGDHPAVERLFSIGMLAANVAFITALWRRFLPADYDWLPTIMWVVPSVVTWVVINNMLENTQAVFTSAAVYALLRTCGPRSRVSSAAWSAVAALATGAAFLVKGPVGLFPLAVPALLLILEREKRPRHLWLVLVVLVGVLGAVAAAVLGAAESGHALQAWASSHLIPVLEGGRGVGQRGADILRHLTLGIWARMAAVVVVLWLFRRRATATRPVDRVAWFFLAVGCAASLPILSSPVLAGHYFFPSTPFFALAFAAAALPAVTSFRPVPGHWTWRAPGWTAAALLAVTAVVLLVHGPLERRNAALIRSLDAIRADAPRGVTVGACASSANDWGLLAYLQRFYLLSVKADGTQASGWFIMTPGACVPPAGCQPVVEAEALVLLRCPAAGP